MKKYQVSVVVPALNEEKNILATIQNIISAFQELKIEGEIIVVDDGSKDNTSMVVEKETERFPSILRIIRHNTPQGIGASFWDGVKISQGEAVVMIPGDNENDAKEILKYYNLLKEVDMVVPFIINKNIRPLFRRFLSFLFLTLVNFSFFTNFQYTNGTVLYRRSVLEQIRPKSRGYFFQTEILIKLAKRGYLFAHVPCKLGKRKEGESKAIKISSLFQILKDYFKVLLEHYFTKLKLWKTSF